MSRLLRGAAVAALTVAAACAVSSAASAQTYNRIVVFGDSLSDNGNLFALIGQPPAPFVNGRFSNGPVFTELLGFNAARVGGSVTGSVNYAYGGALTGSQTFPPNIPGMRTQLTSYTAAGGTFNSGTLVSILGGANNIFQTIGAAGPDPVTFMTGVVVTAATDINFIVDSVAAAGAGTVLVSNLPKLSLTPQFRVAPFVAAAGLADFSASTFNSQLLTRLTATAAARPNTNIILMDLFKVGDVIAANPGAFGLTNVTTACVSGMTVCATPNTFFYFDGVHPTAAGHALLARLAEDYLYYGDAGAQSTVQGETAFRHRQDGLDLSGDRLSGREAWPVGTGITAGAIYDTTETEARGVVGSTESEGYGVRLGLESGTETMRFGLAGSYVLSDVEAGPLQFDVETLALDLYGGWRSQSGLFVNGVASAARDNYEDIERTTTLAPIVHRGHTAGHSLGAKVQAGTWFELGGFAVSPRVGVTWISSEVESYTEQGAAATYVYSDRTIETLSGEAVVRLEAGMGGGFGVYLEGGYRDTFDDSSDAVGVNIAGSPSQTLFTDVDDPLGSQMMINAGVNGVIHDRLKLSVGYRGRFADSTDSHMGGITLTLPLQ